MHDSQQVIDRVSVGPSKWQLQQQINELQTQQLDLSKLTKELADQNQRLVQAVDVLRVRTKVLLAGFIVFAVAVGVLYWR